VRCLGTWGSAPSPRRPGSFPREVAAIVERIEGFPAEGDLGFRRQVGKLLAVAADHDNVVGDDHMVFRLDRHLHVVDHHPAASAVRRHQGAFGSTNKTWPSGEAASRRSIACIWARRAAILSFRRTTRASMASSSRRTGISEHRDAAISGVYGASRFYAASTQSCHWESAGVRLATALVRPLAGIRRRFRPLC
jgi:hypothetical protein